MIEQRRTESNNKIRFYAKMTCAGSVAGNTLKSGYPKLNGGPVVEVIWCERKPILGFFSRVKPKALEADPFPGVDSLAVVKVDVIEASSPALLAKSWSEDED